MAIRYGFQTNGLKNMKIKQDLNVLLENIKTEIDLIFRTDEWLAQERTALAADIDEKVKELEMIYTAIKIKSMLQQKNQVAMKQILRTESGSIKDVIVKIMSLPEAIKALKNCKDKWDITNYLDQVETWNYDGYDLKRSTEINENRE